MPDEDADRKTILDIPDVGEREFDADRLLTRSALSHFKNWFPQSELWQYWGFQAQLSVGDPDAVSCAIWALKRHDGYSPNPEPKSYGRKVGDPADFLVGKVVIAPNRREGVDPPRWKFRLEDSDEDLVLDLDEHLKASHLRTIQKRYPHLGSFAGLYLNLLRGDPDAVAAGIWVARLAANIQPNPLPWDMEDFSVGSVSAQHNLADDDDAFVNPPDPTETGVPLTGGIPTTSTTGPSTGTPTNSGGDGPLPSPTTAPE